MRLRSLSLISRASSLILFYRQTPGTLHELEFYCFHCKVQTDSVSSVKSLRLHQGFTFSSSDNSIALLLECISCCWCLHLCLTTSSSFHITAFLANCFCSFSCSRFAVAECCFPVMAWCYFCCVGWILPICVASNVASVALQTFTVAVDPIFQTRVAVGTSGLYLCLSFCMHVVWVHDLPSSLDHKKVVALIFRITERAYLVVVCPENLYVVVYFVWQERLPWAFPEQREAWMVLI